jgi:hypothetical protein
MTNSSRTDPASARAAKVGWHDDLASLADPFTAAHRAPEASVETFLACQRSLATFKKHLWEPCAVRHASGPPIDT